MAREMKPPGRWRGVGAKNETSNEANSTNPVPVAECAANGIASILAAFPDEKNLDLRALVNALIRRNEARK